MPVITHRKGGQRFVLSYGSHDDLDAVCGAIVAMANRPEFELELADLVALAEQVAEQATREALATARHRSRAR